MALEETLKAFRQWLYGKCMDLHAVSRACHNPDGLVRFSKRSNDMSGYIVGISKPSNKESGTKITEGLVLDAELLDFVFKVPITTIKCISHGCRLGFSQALKTVLCKVVAQPDSVDAWVMLLLFPRCGGDFLEEGATDNTNIKKCLRKVADGHFTTAVKVLSSFGVAPYFDDTFKALKAKHPYKPPLSMPNITFFEPPLVEEIDSVFGCIKSFPKGTSCGRDAGRCLPILAECVESAPLAPLLKPNNEIRPIAIGTIWRHLVFKVSMKGVGIEMSKYLSDFQFGVRVSGGVEHF
nr:reverse transcriptase domain-containing protein [Tanacetum cinerariifolium]